MRPRCGGGLGPNVRAAKGQSQLFVSDGITREEVYLEKWKYAQHTEEAP